MRSAPTGSCRTGSCGTSSRRACSTRCGGSGQIQHTGGGMGRLELDGTYHVDDEDRRRFGEDGYVHLSGVLTDTEVAELEVDYDRFLRREIEVPGKDFCDMAGDYGRDPSDYSIINVLLPRRYFPAWQGN